MINLSLIKFVKKKKIRSKVSCISYKWVSGTYQNISMLMLEASQQIFPLENKNFIPSSSGVNATDYFGLLNNFIDWMSRSIEEVYSE